MWAPRTLRAPSPPPRHPHLTDKKATLCRLGAGGGGLGCRLGRAMLWWLRRAGLCVHSKKKKETQDPLLGDFLRPCPALPLAWARRCGQAFHHASPPPPRAGTMKTHSDALWGGQYRRGVGESTCASWLPPTPFATSAVVGAFVATGLFPAAVGDWTFPCPAHAFLVASHRTLSHVSGHKSARYVLVRAWWMREKMVPAPRHTILSCADCWFHLHPPPLLPPSAWYRLPQAAAPVRLRW